MSFLMKDLREIFNKHDIAEVYGMGDQIDEYDPEIEQLFVRLLKKENHDSLKIELAKIFENMFDEKPDITKIDELSKDIGKYIKELS